MLLILYTTNTWILASLVNDSLFDWFQVEREALRRQVESLSRDISGSTDVHNKLSVRIHELEKENMVYKNRTEEVSHKSKVDLTNLKMEMLKQRSDLERERDKLANLVDGKHIVYIFP